MHSLLRQAGDSSSGAANDGTPLIEATRLPGIRSMYSSPVAANGHVYVFGRNGAAVVLKAGKTFELVSENQLDDRIDASPALVGDLMFVRGLKSLYCLQAQD